MFNFKELLYLVIISFNLVTLMCDSGAILSGEIRCWSILGFKGSEVIAVGNNAKKIVFNTYVTYLFIYTTDILSSGLTRTFSKVILTSQKMINA